MNVDIKHVVIGRLVEQNTLLTDTLEKTRRELVDAKAENEKLQASVASLTPPAVDGAASPLNSTSEIWAGGPYIPSRSPSIPDAWTDELPAD